MTIIIIILLDYHYHVILCAYAEMVAISVSGLKFAPPLLPLRPQAKKTPKLLRQNASYLHKIVAYRPKLHEHDYQRSLDVDF